MKHGMTYGMHSFQGLVWPGMARHGMAWHSEAWCGLVWRGMVWPGMAHGLLARHDQAKKVVKLAGAFLLVRHGMACVGDLGRVRV